MSPQEIVIDWYNSIEDYIDPSDLAKITAALQSERDRAERTRDEKWKSGIDEILHLKLNWNGNPSAPEEDPCETLANYIKQLRTRAEAAEQSLATLREEALRVAKPFAEASQVIAEDDPNRPDDHLFWGRRTDGTGAIRLGHCRAARDFRDKWSKS